MVVISMMHAQARIAFGEAEMCWPESRTGFAVFLFSALSSSQSASLRGFVCTNIFFHNIFFVQCFSFNHKLQTGSVVILRNSR